MINNNNFINKNPTGNDVIKGGVFFGSNLTPSGSFSNIPQYMTTDQINGREPSLMLTLQKVKDSLNKKIKEQTGATTTSDETIEKYLYDFVNLLVDYRDIRNYVFYGSANTEIAYNINYIINNYPYSTLVGQPYGSNFIQITNYIEDTQEKTEILFPETYYYSPTNYVRIILDNYNKFNFNGDNINFDWTKYQVVDKNGKRYDIEKVITPYKSPTIFTVSDIENISVTKDGITYNTIQVTTSAAHTYQVGQIISMFDLMCIDPTITLQYFIQVFNGVGYDNYYYDLNTAQFEIDAITSTTFTVRRFKGDAYENIEIDTHSLIPFYDDAIPGSVKLSPDAMNTRPFVIKMIIKGSMPDEVLLDINYYEQSTKGFIIAPLISVINDWNINLSPVQNMLLAPSPINPTPWPRRPFTNNIMNMLEWSNEDEDNPDEPLLTWIQNPSSLYVAKRTDDKDVDAAWSTYGLLYETNMTRALALDETETNQLIRRCIPADIISEIYDTPDFYFQRFILIAGWMFDQTRLYAKFVKYAHTVNTTQFNQLSPEYYRYLADYWGLNLFSDDQIDFSKLVIQTVPGEYFGVTQAQIEANRYYQQTLQQVQHTRQKNLLMSIIFLYKQKGTQNSIKKLISLLGAPDGFLAFDEYAFKVNDLDKVGYPTRGYRGKKIINNDKVHVPNVTFEIDPDYLIDKTNVNNAVNKPYVYRRLLDNEYTHNLREISVLTDPNGAIDNQIINYFGEQLYNYITFNQGEFSNLQKDGKYFLLPLSLPDRFYGMSVEYMIPRDGMMKGIGSDQEEAVCDIFSLYRIKPADLNPTILITDITIDATFTTIQITTVNPHGYIPGDNVFISNTTGINKLNDKMFIVETTINPTTFTIFGDFSGLWTGGGQVVSGELDLFDNTTGDDLQYTYPIAIRYPQRNRDIDTSFALDNHANSIPDGYTNPSGDFHVLKNRYPDATYIDDSYIITRLEGNDLVIRLRIQSELTGLYGERCAMMENIFAADGLNHSLRMILREDGVEIFKDYRYAGIAKWINISNAGPYLAYEVPKYEIKALLLATDNCTDYYEPIDVSAFVANPEIYHTNADAINWWDLFIGMPDGVKFNFKKVNFFDNSVVNDYNVGDRITESNNKTAEFYLFEVANPTMNSRTFREYDNHEVPAVFYKLFPNSLPIYYGYALPQIQDQYSRDIIEDLALTNKKIFTEVETNTLLVNHKQDFFKFEDVFGNNAWMPDIHKAEVYTLFNGLVNDLYILYGAQVLTYAALQEFMELVEQKFRVTFKEFIPIVINIEEFGRLIRNSIFMQAKNRIPGNDKICTMQYGASPSEMVTLLFKKSFDDVKGINNSSFTFTLKTNTGVVIAGPVTVPYTINQFKTLQATRDALRLLPMFVGGYANADVYSHNLRITVKYEWFMDTYGLSPDNLLFVVQQGSTIINHEFANGHPIISGLHSAVYDSCGYLVTEASDDKDTCGDITYILPNLQPKPPYVYYETENKPPTYVRYSTEIGSNPVYVHFSTE